MKQTEARRSIIRVWRSWRVENTAPDKKPTGDAALVFFMDLKHDRPDLLRFRYCGDKWQIVHSWLFTAGLVTD